MREFCFYQYFVPNGTFVFEKTLICIQQNGIGKGIDTFGGKITLCQ